MKLKNNEPCQHCGRFAKQGVSIDAAVHKLINEEFLKKIEK